MDTLEMILNSLCDTGAERGLGPIENIEMWIPGSIEDQYGVKSSCRYNLFTLRTKGFMIQ